MAKNGTGKRPKLFVGRSDRLIARLKSILYAWRFMDQVGGQLFALWTKLPSRYDDEMVGYSPANIFDLVKFYAEGGADRLCFLDHADRYPETEAINLGDAAFSSAAQDGFDRSRFENTNDVFVQRGTGRFFFSDEPIGGSYMIDGVRKLFNELPVHPAVEQHLSRFYENFQIEPDGYGAIHFRRGDVYEMLLNEMPDQGDDRITEKRLDLLVNHFIVRTAPVEFYQPYVEKMISENKKIVFTSDSPETIEIFREAFGRPHFIDLSQFRLLIPIRKAFLDFLILSKASEVIGTASNFSQFASEIGGTPSVSVSGSGEYHTIESEFRKSILDRIEVDDAIGKKALAILEDSYDKFSTRVQNSLSRRGLKQQ